MLVADAVTGIIIDANPAAAVLLGRPVETIRGMHQSALHADAESARTSFQNDRRIPGASEHLVRRGDGLLVPVEISGSPMCGDRGQPLVLGIFRDLTERWRAEAQLRESEARFRIMADGCPSVVWVTDADGNLRFANRAFREFCGATYEQIEDTKWQQFVHPDDLEGYWSAFSRSVKNQASFKAEVRAQREDGAWRWMAAIAEPRFSTGNEYLGHVGVATDVTDRHEAEQALRSSEEKFRQLAENIREVFWVMNAARTEVLYVSPAYEQIWGRRCEDLRRNPASWLEAIETDGAPNPPSAFARAPGCAEVESEYRIHTAYGQIKWIRERAFLVRDGTGEVVRVVGIAEDISARKRAEFELEYQARHDYLTGLPNRLFLAEVLERRLKQGASHGFQTAIMYIDLDGFKFVNDTLGHEAGDTLLRQATQRLQDCIRNTDTLARVGGDEFLAVVARLHDDAGALAVAEKFRLALSEPFRVTGLDIRITASLGVAMYPRDGTDTTTLRSRADAAMYEAKLHGKNQVLFFAPEMLQRFRQQMTAAAQTPLADEARQLSLDFHGFTESLP